MAGGDDTTIPASTNALFVPRLEIIVEREAGEVTRRETILDEDCLRIGSHPSNGLVLDDPRVSRFHCRIERELRAWRLTDEGSMNGTRVSGIRVRDAELRMPESTIELGDSVVRVRELSSTAVRAGMPRGSFGALRGRSQAMQRLFGVLERVGNSDATVLVEGESGTGKELVATEIVRRGARADRPFIVVDCSAISPNLIESELFGHARGAFTGADRERIGAFEAADGGTVFLDEIGEMALEMQPKLLRALESREIRRVGETRARKTDVRVIAATNRRLEREVNRGRFREDLFFRLSVVTVRIPPLRDRLEDLELLVQSCLDALDAPDARRLFTAEVLEAMARHDWPGNVRELRNYVERAIVLDAAQPTTPDDDGHDDTDADPEPEGVDLDVPFKAAKDRALRDFERRYLASLLAWSGGNVSRAARRAKMDRMNLHRLVQAYGIPAGRALKD
jgi:DNA-binding NtrC family response regulator